MHDWNKCVLCQKGEMQEVIILVAPGRTEKRCNKCGYRIKSVEGIPLSDAERKKAVETLKGYKFHIGEPVGIIFGTPRDSE